MKLTQEFVLRNIAGEHVLIPLVGLDDKFQGIITLNETGAFIWKKIEDGLEKGDIISAILEEYETSLEKATADVEKFCAHLADLGILV